MDLIGRPIEVGRAQDINGHDFNKRIYSKYGKSPTLTTVTGGNQHRKFAINDYEYRRFTPIECERLQTVDDNYTNHVSNSQRYKMLGNGWTVEVIAGILGRIKWYFTPYTAIPASVGFWAGKSTLAAGLAIVVIRSTVSGRGIKINQKEIKRF